MLIMLRDTNWAEETFSLVKVCRAECSRAVREWHQAGACPIGNSSECLSKRYYGQRGIEGAAAATIASRKWSGKYELTSNRELIAR